MYIKNYQRQTQKQKQVISIEDINEVIDIMGRPEDFEDEEENKETEIFQ